MKYILIIGILIYLFRNYITITIGSGAKKANTTPKQNDSNKGNDQSNYVDYQEIK